MSKAIDIPTSSSCKGERPVVSVSRAKSFLFFICSISFSSSFSVLIITHFQFAFLLDLLPQYISPHVLVVTANFFDMNMFWVILSMVVGFIALFSGFHRYHRKLYPFYSLALGGVIYAFKDILGEELEPVVITIGASLIVLAHILNIKLCRSCKTC